MIPAKFEPVVFGLILSGLMSLVVSGISAAVAGGFGTGLASLWTKSWLTAWLLAFPIVLLAGALARRLVRARSGPSEECGGCRAPDDALDQGIVLAAARLGP